MRLTRLAGWLPFRRRPGSDDSDQPDMSRRALAGVTAGLLLPAPAAAATAEALEGLDRAQLSAMLRGLADLERRHDSELKREGDVLMARITAVMPEAPLILALHRHYRASGNSVLRPPLRIDLTALHRACRAAQPVSFDYTDLYGNSSSRRVLPLELVHPAHGIQLLAWCELRGAQRKFFLHAMDRLTIHAGDFTQRRAELLADALAEVENRFDTC